MSRAYRVRVRQSLKRELKGSDEICTDLELLDILPPEQMGELLAGELRERGFEQGDDGKLSREQGNVVVTVDPSNGEVSVTSNKSEEVEIEASREGVSYDDFGPGEKATRKKLEKEVQDDLERRATQQTERLQQQATEELERELAGLQEELNGVTHRVTAEALKAKARQMGDIKEISEDPEAGSLTIKVEV